MDWIQYANQNATRRLPLDPKLIQAMSFLPEMGLQMRVFSGGQPGIGSGLPRVGSTRHDHGNAADVFFYKDGQQLDWANPDHLPVFQEIVRRGKAAGLTGFGAGPGYMQQGSMHIGFGNPGVWGAGGSSKNAPEWLVQAFNDGPSYEPGTVIAANDFRQPPPGLNSKSPIATAGRMPLGMPQMASKAHKDARSRLIAALLSNAASAFQPQQRSVQTSFMTPPARV